MKLSIQDQKRLTSSKTKTLRGSNHRAELLIAGLEYHLRSNTRNPPSLPITAFQPSPPPPKIASRMPLITIGKIKTQGIPCSIKVPPHLFRISLNLQFNRLRRFDRESFEDDGRVMGTLKGGGRGFERRTCERRSPQLTR